MSRWDMFKTQNTHIPAIPRLTLLLGIGTPLVWMFIEPHWHLVCSWFSLYAPGRCCILATIKIFVYIIILYTVLMTTTNQTKHLSLYFMYKLSCNQKCLPCKNNVTILQHLSCVGHSVSDQHNWGAKFLLPSLIIISFWSLYDFFGSDVYALLLSLFS
jgi:hypothetical protein